MSHLDAARFQMAYSLFFHMIFAALGVGMPALLAAAEYRHLRTRDRDYQRLARTWARATAVLFAIGAVSGTDLAFELGLLLPEFMHFAGSTVGPAFTLEGYAFFTEAIFIGLYLYGRERMRPAAHWLTAVAVAVSGAASSVLVTAANAWQHHPVGVELLQTQPEAMSPWTVFTNPHWPVMAVHSTVACYAATGFAVAGVYAWGMLRGRTEPLRQKALHMALAMGLLAAITMPVTGDLSAKVVARHQPEKLAAMEALFATRTRAPLLVGGLPDPEARTVPFAVELPGLLSYLAYGRFDAEVMGLDRVPRAEWPNVPLVHLSFQLMVGAGVAMVLVGLYYAWARWRRPAELSRNRRLLWLLVLASPLGYLALEAGWITAEAGRHPWTIWKVMLTADAVTPSGGSMALSVAGFTALYALLAAALVLILTRLRHE